MGSASDASWPLMREGRRGRAGVTAGLDGAYSISTQRYLMAITQPLVCIVQTLIFYLLDCGFWCSCFGEYGCRVHSFHLPVAFSAGTLDFPRKSLSHMECFVSHVVKNSPSSYAPGAWALHCVTVNYMGSMYWLQI